MKKSRILFTIIFAAFLGLFLVSCDLPTHEHTYIVREAVEPTCTKEGNIAYYECSGCHRYYSDQACENEIKKNDLIVPAKGHTLTEVAAVEPSCTTEGNIQHFECTECGTLLDAENNVLSANDVVVVRTPHVGQVIEAVEPDCVNAGSIEHYECSICDKKFLDAECTIELKAHQILVDALGHTMTEHQRVEADCLNPGTILYYDCSVCNKFFADSEGNQELTAEELVVEALGHAMTEHAEVLPDCVNTGLVHHFECSVCNKFFADSEGSQELTAEELVVEALGHTMVEHQPVETTCGQAGSIHYFECSVCNKFFADSEGSQELTAEELVVPALTHSFTEHAEVAAVVGTPGHVQYFECNNCSKLYLDQEGLVETTLEEVVRYAYLVSKNDAVTAGYYVDYTESYTFVDVNNTGAFVSNNKGINNASSYLHLYFTASGVVSFEYSVSSEVRYDTLTIWAQSDGESHRTIVEDASGVASGSFTLTVEAGDYIYFQFKKDSSGNRNDDCAIVSNILFVTNDLYEKSTLTFESNGGSEVSSIEMYNGVAVTEPQAPVKEGYFFDGWYTDVELTNAFNFANGLSESITVYAKYTKGVTVSFTNTGDSTVESVLVRPNAAIEVPSVIPTSATQYFKGWYSDAECTVEFDFAAGVAADTVVYAGWRNPVVVTFDVNGGSEVPAISTDINVALTAPANPTKDLHKFGGWYSDAECTVEFDFAAGVTADTVVYANWIAQVEVTYMNGNVVVGTEYVDNGAEFTPSNPEDFVEVVEGWFLDAELTNEFVDGTVVSANFVLYAKVHQFAPEGVLESMVNGDGSSVKEYPWVYDLVSNTFSSSNNGVSSSASVVTFTFAKESFVSFDYVVNSESNYDYLKVYVNGTQVLSTRVSGMNGVDVTGSYTHIFSAGDTLKFEFTKDSSGNKGTDNAIISNLMIRDGVPSINVTLDYQDEGVADQVISTGINSVIVNIENFASFAPADSEARRFGGWYFDAECTMPVETDDVVLENITLYAKYLYPATITFDSDGAGEIAPILVWTGVAVENMPANPSKDGYIFRYWLDENADQFVPENGISGDTFLTAYFEELPVGATIDEALVVELTNGAYVSELLTTTEEFQNFYTLFTPSKTDYYYFFFESGNITIEGGKVTYTSYRRYTITDTEGNVVLSPTSSDAKVILEGGKTYVVAYNLGNGSNTAWGTFVTEIYAFEHDYGQTEAIDYVFGETVTLAPATFVSRTETIIYKLVAQQSGTYAAHVATDDWANISIYTDAELKNRVAYKNASSTSGMKDEVVDLVMTEGQTYYIVLSQNWTDSECLENTIEFRVVEYPQGYATNNPFDYVLGETINAEFNEGANAYYQVVITEAGTYKLDILSISDENSKTVDLYNADLSNKIATLAGDTACEYYIEVLEAGTYILKVYNTSTSYKTSFTASLSKVETGGYWTTASELIVSETMNLNANVEGYYYSFTTGAEKLWYFFTPSAGSVKVYDSSRKELGSSGLQLEANTQYFLVVTAEVENVEVAHNTLVEYADGKTPAGAFTYSEETKTLNTAQASYTVYFKFTASEDGTYRFYSNNGGSIDTKGYLYSDPEFSSQLKYNDDGGSSRVTEGVTGYKYDFYFEFDLVAGQTYYLKVTYSVYAANENVNMFVGIDKVQ